MKHYDSTYCDVAAACSPTFSFLHIRELLSLCRMSSNTFPRPYTQDSEDGAIWVRDI